jgi:hypothetical protein
MNQNKAAQHRLHLTAFGAGTRRQFARKCDFQQSRLTHTGGK